MSEYKCLFCRMDCYTPSNREKHEEKCANDPQSRQRAFDKLMGRKDGE